MSVTYTENYNLGKQENHSEKFDMAVITENMDKIDTAMAEQKAEIAENSEALSSETSSRQEEDSRQQVEIALNRSTLGYQRKNLLKNTAVSNTVNGVTFTVNDDGSVTANGTATATATFILKTFLKSDFSAGKYIYSGCIGGSADTYFLRYYKITAPQKIYDVYDGSIILQHEEAEGNFAIIVRANATIDTVFYPMIRYAEITDDTYEPYKPSVEERLAALEATFMAAESGT